MDEIKMDIVIYKLSAFSIIDNTFLYDVALYSDESVALRALGLLSKNTVDIAARFIITPIILNASLRHQDTLAEKGEIATPKYITEAVKNAAKDKEVETGINTIMMKSINKILTEVEACIDNPEILKEYIIGLRDNTEDYL